MNVVASNIERIIHEKGYKKNAVATRAGITGQKLCDMLAGRAIIRAEMVPNLCYALGVEPNELYRETTCDEGEKQNA